ncbi:coniferyl aldehyde dehydrogenase [Tropicimonas sp. TH_r6]|uniref:coniferyl aldehyde dehydrogenase n=1 Tax=Tropicimonas sp. TH_r6 TaxID=3082085 RepID=UPI0029558D6A|nr:coniferyl aldehyde dehydrogenase [Tropicimonas sp. TH_r6]MDV7142472.1 coniferyl aldehyde dehydrogenase [Tropicimonas sp. TH_r6]
MPDGTVSHSIAGEEILARQRAAFRAEPPPDLATRRAALKRLKQAIGRNRKRLQDAAREDFGNRASEETAIIDLGPTVQAISHMRSNLRRWMAVKYRSTPMLMKPGRARLHYQPLGVVGIMSAWNYPVALALTPLATALAAGNRAMLKPSELAPATADALTALLTDSFPQDEVAVIQGGPEVAAAFSALPFDHLFFTGSTATGRHVAKAAAANLTPVTLELGGKSPVILNEDADLALAAGDIAFGKTVNAGQTCIAPDYLLARPDQVAPFAEAFSVAIRKSFPKGLADPALTTIVNDRHLARLHTLLDDARAEGAEIIAPLAASNEAHPRALGPALILGATPEMEIMQEEIFGPLLPILTCESIEEAAAFVNARPHPLALYIYGQDRTNIDALLTGTISGNVTVNGAMLHYAVDTLPFGGVGESGMGAYHGVEGFRRLSHAKGVFQPAPHHGARLLRPPYGKLARMAARFLLR